MLILNLQEKSVHLICSAKAKFQVLRSHLKLRATWPVATLGVAGLGSKVGLIEKNTKRPWKKSKGNW
jgi:hypothetical protein